MGVLEITIPNGPITVVALVLPLAHVHGITTTSMETTHNSWLVLWLEDLMPLTTIMMIEMTTLPMRSQLTTMLVSNLLWQPSDRHVTVDTLLYHIIILYFI